MYRFSLKLGDLLRVGFLDRYSLLRNSEHDHYSNVIFHDKKAGMLQPLFTGVYTPNITAALVAYQRRALKLTKSTVGACKIADLADWGEPE